MKKHGRMTLSKNKPALLGATQEAKKIEKGLKHKVGKPTHE